MGKKSDNKENSRHNGYNSRNVYKILKGLNKPALVRAAKSDNTVMKRILFIDKDNSCRAQMAEAFANFYAKGILRAYSAGSGKARMVSPLTLAVMREKGLDLSGAQAKQYSLMLIKHFDYVVFCGRDCRFSFANARTAICLDVPLPSQTSFYAYRLVRDCIEEQVQKLLCYISRDTIERRRLQSELFF